MLSNIPNSLPKEIALAHLMNSFKSKLDLYLNEVEKKHTFTRRGLLYVRLVTSSRDN